MTRWGDDGAVNPAVRRPPWPGAVTRATERALSWTWGPRFAARVRPGPVTQVRELIRRSDRPPEDELRRAYELLGLAEGALFDVLGPRGGIRMTRAQEAAAHARLATDPRLYRRARVIERLRRQLIRRAWAGNPRPRRSGPPDPLTPRAVVTRTGSTPRGSSGWAYALSHLWGPVWEVSDAVAVGRFWSAIWDRARDVWVVVSPGVQWREGRAEEVYWNPWRHQRLASARAFDPRSFRTVTPAPGVRVTVGCPVGAWDARRRRCRVGTRAQRVLRWASNPEAPWHERQAATWQALAARFRPGVPRRRYAEGAADAHAFSAWVDRQQNPPRRRVLIYPRVDAICARKLDGPARGRYVHRFRTPVLALGEPDGSVRLVPR